MWSCTRKSRVKVKCEYICGVVAEVRPGVSSFGAGHSVTAREQTFVLGFGVKALSFTTSKFGITAKDLLGKS